MGKNDFMIVGDMNIQSCEELEELLPRNFVALNDEWRDTVQAKASRPYGQFFYRSDTTDEIIEGDSYMRVMDLVSGKETDSQSSRRNIS